MRSLIRENKSQQIGNAISVGGGGMISMEHSLLTLYQQGLITRECALEHAYHPDQLMRRIG